MNTSKTTPFYECHIASNGKMVDFAGWQLPVHYGSLTEEHFAVRNDAGMFDVSHMTIVDIEGMAARALLRTLLANDINTLKEQGKALYSCMLNENGGVIDDLICYYFHEEHYRLIVNAATREQDLAWIYAQSAGYDVTISERAELAMLAIQGPNAIEKANRALSELKIDPPKLKRFQAVKGENLMIARTGYTGEDGYEIAFDPSLATMFWDALQKHEVHPAGLGARDSLRLEAGMALYGNDLDQEHTPLESGLAWTVNLNDDSRTFNGKDALIAQRQSGIPTSMIGVVLDGKGVMRAHQIIKHNEQQVGELTSGGYSPCLKRSIGLARVGTGASETDDLNVVIRTNELPLSTVPYPFYRNGKASF